MSKRYNISTLRGNVEESLKHHEMMPELPQMLMSEDKKEVRVKDENELWDYKYHLNLTEPLSVAELAKDVLSFHNTKGGMLVIGVADNYKICGVSENTILDTKNLKDKLGKYIGNNVNIFQDHIKLPTQRFIWLIFISPKDNHPIATQKEGPQKNKKPLFPKGRYYYRDND